MTFADLPGQGEQLALAFNGDAEELSHYFTELEALYDWHTFTDVAKTDEDFKQEIHKYYPGSSKDIYTIHHLDTLIGRHA
jgi:hypothetical protein